MSTKAKASIEDLYRLPDNRKAELVNGEIVLMAATGYLPSRAGLNIALSLREYEWRTQSGHACPDNTGFLVNLPHRESFSPDAAFHTGTPTGMKFLEGAPIFAVEVRSEGDYGPEAEAEMASKRRDYFAARTLIVWDVDLLGEEVVKVYRAAASDTPTIYRRGEIAEADPALPGWSMPVDELFA